MELETYQYYLFNLPLKCSNGNNALLATRLSSMAAHLHIAHKKQSFQQEMTEFISPDLWRPNRADLNPVDYIIWGLV